MINPLVIRQAKPQESIRIGELAMRSKAYWGYSVEFLEACREELCVTAEKITSEYLHYFVAEHDSKLIGYYAIEKNSENEYELDGLFVEPAFMGRGVGKALMDHAKRRVIELGGKTLLIQSDPNVVDFYRASGGKPIGMRESRSIPGRNLPLIIIELLAHEEDA